MSMVFPASESPQASLALTMVTELQNLLANKVAELDSQSQAKTLSWLRNEGRNGGGQRIQVLDSEFFHSASMNVSQVHYSPDSGKAILSATALSSILHPRHSARPSLHTHISWTEKADGESYWRLMADLNPSMPLAEDTATFTRSLQTVCGSHSVAAQSQGDRYFRVPALERTRGVSHFYLENFRLDTFDAELQFARDFGRQVVDTWGKVAAKPELKADDHASEQLAYHTLYFFQVLTLDRGTISGVLVHDQNDLGIMGSLPPRIDRELLASWQGAVVAPQEKLVGKLLDCLPQQNTVVIDDQVKLKLVQALRAFYRDHPDAVQLLASGGTIADTVGQHR